MGASQSLVENLRHSAAQYPDRCAIKDGAFSISYAELLRQSIAVSAGLRVHGLRRGERVALILQNSIEFVAIYYGVLMAGGVAVPMNAAGKTRDFTAWLADCDAAFVVAEQANVEVGLAVAALERKPEIIRLSDDVEAAFGAAAAPVDDPAGWQGCDSDSPACILYTSGTTGAPKGVMLSHENLAANTAAIVEYLQLTCADSSVTVLPFYYSYGSSVLHSHLQVGARLVLEKNLLYPHAVVERLAAEQATGFAGVPSTYALLLARVKLQDYDLSGIRYLTQAGGPMSPALTQRLRSVFPQASVIVMYGQTEATARLTYLPAQQLDNKAGSVGIPIPGVKIEIRNEEGRVVPADTVGEIWASGRNVMLGYWRNEAATREVKRDGWLKTGDMGRLDSDGFLYIVGRRSDMIKAGAHRIQPQDIEDVIAELPQVQEAAVIGVEDEMLGQTIKAFVVVAEPATLTPLQIKAHCRERLASYKVPKSVEIVMNLPRTASGKLRRAELVERIERSKQ